MTLRHLYVFTTVYQEMSITRAAQKLYISQPGVSLAIRELEEYYQVSLFHRINRKIFPTEKGELLYQYASQITELSRETEQMMRHPEIPLHFHIGASVTIGTTILPQAVKRFQDRYENCEVQVTIQNSRSIEQSVVKNEQDIGLVEDQIKNSQLVEIPFCQDPFHFICSSSHPLAKQREVSLEEICAYPFFSREIGSASREVQDSFLKLRQMNYRIMWESSSNQAVIRGLKMLDGIAVFPERLVERELREGELVILPCQPEEFDRQFSLIYHKRKNMSPVFQSFIDILVEEGGRPGI
ncbi:MAG: LysR family transcriptional regulator [Eubacteriales bacterium]|nr:LysR family transcriptional regulator [Eubacteriales bacterium]